MRDGAKSMKKEMKSVNLNVVEDVQDDMEDLLEQSNEIQVRIIPLSLHMIHPRNSMKPLLPCIYSTGGSLKIIRRLSRS
jgi:hypothetical protein